MMKFPPRPGLRLGLLLILALGYWSCAKDPSGVTDTPLTQPFLVSASLSSSFFNLDTSTVNITHSTSGVYTVTVTLIARALRAAGSPNPLTASYSFFPPLADYATFTGNMNQVSTSGDTILYSAVIQFTAQRTDIGTYTISAYASSGGYGSSNTITLPLILTRKDSRPLVFNVSAPDTIVRPAHGELLYIFSVSASDSDGYADIQQVFFKRILPNTSANIQMFDDGNYAVDGDLVAGDGIFSRIVEIDSSNTPGTKVFLFQAEDRAGEFSDSLTQSIVIQ
jgi:hypothetical protein